MSSVRTGDAVVFINGSPPASFEALVVIESDGTYGMGTVVDLGVGRCVE
jgi:hypothetical protein